MVLLPSFYKFLERMRVAFSQFPVFFAFLVCDLSQIFKKFQGFLLFFF
eukprot:COSAG02_NODE_73788_length_166_cov_938.223881_1_plen_47_part_01